MTATLDLPFRKIWSSSFGHELLGNKIKQNLLDIVSSRPTNDTFLHEWPLSQNFLQLVTIRIVIFVPFKKNLNKKWWIKYPHIWFLLNLGKKKMGKDILAAPPLSICLPRAALLNRRELWLQSWSSDYSQPSRFIKNGFHLSRREKQTSASDAGKHRLDIREWFRRISYRIDSIFAMSDRI